MLEQVSAHHVPIESSEPATPADEIRTLEARLDRGWSVISDAEQRGESTEHYFNHFLDLLRQYEELYDANRAA